MLLTLVGTVNPALTLDAATLEAIRGIFSKEMSQTTISAPIGNYSIYMVALIIIAVIIAFTLIIRMTVNGLSVSVKNGLQPFVTNLNGFKDSLEKSINSTHESFKDAIEELQITNREMAGRFVTLTDKITEAQSIRQIEVEKINHILIRIDRLENETSSQWDGLRNNIEALKIEVIRHKDYCSVTGIRRLSRKILDKGLLTEEQVDMILSDMATER